MGGEKLLVGVLGDPKRKYIFLVHFDLRLVVSFHFRRWDLFGLFIFFHIAHNETTLIFFLLLLGFFIRRWHHEGFEL